MTWVAILLYRTNFCRGWLIGGPWTGAGRVDGRFGFDRCLRKCCCFERDSSDRRSTGIQQTEWWLH